MTDPGLDENTHAAWSWHRITTRLSAVTVLAASFLPIIAIGMRGGSAFSVSVWNAVTADDPSIWVWLSPTCAAAGILSIEIARLLGARIPWHFVRPAVASAGIAWTFLTWLDIHTNYTQEATEDHGDALIGYGAAAWLALLALWLLAGIKAHHAQNAQRGAYLMMAVAALCSFMNLAGLALLMELWIGGPDQAALPIRMAWGMPILLAGSLAMLIGLIGTLRALPTDADDD